MLWNWLSLSTQSVALRQASLVGLWVQQHFSSLLYCKQDNEGGAELKNDEQ
jgi:hypothetical protein